MPKTLIQKAKTVAVLSSPLSLTAVGAIAGSVIFGGLFAPIALGALGAFTGASVVGSALSGVTGNRPNTPLQVAGKMISQPVSYVAQKVKNAFTSQAKPVVETAVEQTAAPVAAAATSAPVAKIVKQKNIRVGFAGSGKKPNVAKSAVRARVKSALKRKNG